MNQDSRRAAEANNRRRFCRIDDEVILQYQELSDRGGRGRRNPREQGATAFLACSRLAEYRQQMGPAFRKVRDESPATANLLSLLDKKIDLVASFLLLEDIDSISDALRSRVQLSASGIVFRTNREYRNNTLFLLRFILLPTFVGIITEGRVVRSTRFLREVDGCLYATTVEFLNMKESTRDLIAKHVMEHQTEHMRREKQ